MNKIVTRSITGALVGLSLALTACGGGGGGGSSTTTTPPPYNQAAHDQLAQAFINEATAEGLGYTLVKADTQTQGYIVVSTSTGVLEAFDIDNWVASEKVSAFVADYVGLTPAGNNTYTYYVSQGYEDIEYVSSGYWSYDAYGNATWIDTSGYVDYGWVDTSYTMSFSVAQPASKDLQKVAAFKQAYDVNASALKVQTKFGLSLERSTEVAKLAIQVKNTPKMSNDDYDSLSQQLLGVPVAKLDSAINATANNASDAQSQVNDILSSAATTNGVGPEQARQLLNSITTPSGSN